MGILTGGMCTCVTWPLLGGFQYITNECQRQRETVLWSKNDRLSAKEQDHQELM